jgi:hypothetical protein
VFSLVCQVPEVPARLADPTYSELVPSDKSSYYLNRPPYTYLEACLIKVIGIFIKDTILSFNTSY